MRLQADDRVWVDLRLVGYQFPDTANDSWLVVHCEASSEEGSWSFTAPALEALEAEAIGDWLRQAADGLVEPAASDDGTAWPNLGFTEPNLAFDVRSVGDTDVELLVYFRP